MTSKAVNTYLPRVVCIMIVFIIILIAVYLIASSPLPFNKLLAQIHT